MSPPRQLLTTEDERLLPWWRHSRKRLIVAGSVGLTAALLTVVLIAALAKSSDAPGIFSSYDWEDQSIYIFGGHEPSVQRLHIEHNPAMSDAEPLPIKAQTKKLVTAMPFARLDTAAVYWRGKIFIFGGEAGQTNASSRVDILDPVTDQWAQGPSMHVGREEHVAVVINDTALMVCGCDLIEQINCLHTCETLTYEGRQKRAPYEKYSWSIGWTPACAMYSSAVQHEGSVYITGSWCVGKGREMHIFNTQTGEWTLGAPLVSERAGHAATVYKDELWLCGGSDGPSDQQNTCEKYNFDTQTWSEAAHMTQKRNNLELVAAADGLFAIGGYPGGGGFLDTIEYLDGGTMRWSLLNTTRLAYPVWKHSAVLVDKPIRKLSKY